MKNQRWSISFKPGLNLRCSLLSVSNGALVLDSVMFVSSNGLNEAILTVYLQHLHMVVLNHVQ